MGRREAAGEVRSGAGPAAAAAPRGDGDVVATFAAAILCGTVILWYLLTFNTLVRARNAVDQAWAHIEVELKRRFDLVNNLVEVAKGYARHESDTFREVAALRTRARPFADASAANGAEPELARAIGRVMILAEDYPELRADRSFLNLQRELAETENRIAERRHAYNQTVNRYLILIQSVPSNVVAGIQSMPERAFFDDPNAAIEEPPAVKLT